MKISKLSLLSVAILLSVTILLSRCKSPTATGDATVTSDSTSVTKTDSAIAPTDTTHAAAADTTPAKPTHTPLTLVIKNLESEDAPIVVGLYGVENKFPDPKDQLKEYRFKPHGKEHTAQIRDLKFGTYALAIYQDVNSNGKIDKNIIGIPTEPYAFSNNYKPTVKAPAFKNCKFDYDSVSNTVTMKMIK